MSSWDAAKEADRRLSILLLLAQDAQGSANEILLQDALPGLGHNPSVDILRADLIHLRDVGGVVLASPGGITMAQITARGLDVTAGRTTLPGVKKPRIGVFPPPSA